MYTTQADPMHALYAAVKAHSQMEDDQLREAGQYGADAGWPGFCYYTECCTFYQANKTAIWDLAATYADDFGYKSVPEFVASFGRAELADTADGFENLLAWFALEEVGRWLEDHPQDEEESEEA